MRWKELDIFTRLVSESMVRLIGTKIVYLTFLFLLCSQGISAQAVDVHGWQEASWGMSESEIQAKFAGQLSKLPKAEKFAKMYVDHVISPYEISTGKYTVRFQMNDETRTLEQILIRLDVMESLIPNELYFRQLDSLLTEKYGQPLWKSDLRRADDVKLERKWLFPTTTIELGYTWMRIGSYNLLTVRYYPTKKSEAQKI